MVKLDVVLPIKYNTEIIKSALYSSLGTQPFDLSDIRILKRTLQLDGASAPCYKATVAFSSDRAREDGLLKIRNRVSVYERESFIAPLTKLDCRPVVVGSGPAGLFSALTLAEAGCAPIVLERGLSVEERAKRITRFKIDAVLDTECNVQFGEGGAGTYSDGKLKTGAMNKYKTKVLDEFILAGADESIAYSSNAHLGTDKLPLLVKNIREKIKSLGGEFIFGARLTDIVLSGNALRALRYVKGGEECEIETDLVILAIGHSARDTIRMLYSKGLAMTAKGFGVGMRVEHPREYINSIVYKEHASEIEDSASYHLVTHLKNGRSVYSFCMCPGGTVVSATSNECGIVTNGMSEYDRMADNSNSAILVSVTPQDFASDHPLAGIEYQERIERRAYSLTSNYRAPAEMLGRFLAEKSTEEFSEVSPSYERGVEIIRAEEYLPQYITSSVRLAFDDFDEWMPGFKMYGATLTGPETRTTSPVRIERTDNNEAVGFLGIFTAGEGAGYAGGIVSSATDGILTAEKLLCLYGRQF